MSDSGSGWDRRRSERLRETLTEAELEALAKRAELDPGSVTLVELGALFLATKDRIRTIESKARRRGLRDP